jgi:predicted metal-dependent hydrolase
MQNIPDDFSLKKLLRHLKSDPRQLALQLDFFSNELSSLPPVDSPTPQQGPRTQPRPGDGGPALPPPSALPLAGGKRRIQLSEHTLDYSLRRSKRRSIGFLISDEGLRITAPKWVTLGEIENAIREKQRWIFIKLNEQRERSARQLKPQMKWQDGASFPYLGETVTLRIASMKTAGIHFNETTRELIVCLPADAGEQQIKDRVQAWLQLEAKRLFGERLPIYAEKLGVTYQSFALTSAMTQWGSCTADGKIRLNWRLMHFALPQIDYVIAHELSHLREMNHSPRFWATVQSVFPEFEAAKRTLHDKAPETIPIF